MNVICLEDAAFYVLIDNVIESIREKAGLQPNRWITGKEAMAMLDIKSPTTLAKLREEGKIRAAQPGKHIVYDRDSILDCLDDFAYEMF